MIRICRSTAGAAAAGPSAIESLETRVLMHTGAETGGPPDVTIGTPADVLRVNVGGKPMTTAAGLSVGGDSGFAGGKASRAKFKVADTDDDLLFSNRRV